MRRREFIALVGGVVVWPHAARAQQHMSRIALYMNFAESDPEAQSSVRALVDRLQELGWTNGRNARIDYRWGAADPA